jgi:tetratricopeptide (TPR) repeat protein
VLRDSEVDDPLLAELTAANRRSLPAFQRGIHAIREGDYPAGVARFAEGLAVDPDNAAARLSYARALWLAGQPDQAGVELARVLEQDDRLPLAHFLTGVLAARRNDQDAAATAWRRTLALEPTHAGALFYLANLDFAAGRFAAAAEGYSKALAADAGIAPARLLALVAALHAGEPAATVAARLLAVTAAHPDDPQARYALARLLAAADDPAVRDPTQARALAAALAVAQPIPPHQRALALAEAANGRFDRATEMLEGLLLTAWMAPPAERGLIQQELNAVRADRVPTPAWPVGDPLLGPPPFDPLRPFRDYPATVPY